MRSDKPYEKRPDFRSCVQRYYSGRLKPANIVLCPKLEEIIKVKFILIHWYPPPRKGERQLYKTLAKTILSKYRRLACLEWVPDTGKIGGIWPAYPPHRQSATIKSSLGDIFKRCPYPMHAWDPSPSEHPYIHHHLIRGQRSCMAVFPRCKNKCKSLAIVWMLSFTCWMNTSNSLTLPQTHCVRFAPCSVRSPSPHLNFLSTDPDRVMALARVTLQ